MINVAILGAGIGKSHLEGYRALTDQFTVAAVCDLDIARAKAATNNDTSIQVVSDIETVLSNPDIDLIDICLPPHLHVSNVIRALESGKHAVCEKPIARSLAEIEQMQTAMNLSGLQIFPVFQYRFGLGLAQLSALQDSGLTGRAIVASADTHWNRDSAYYAVPWRGTWESESGGAILGHAIHMHDLLCDILGPVDQLTAYCDTLVNDIEVEDCAAISMRMKSGALVTSSVTLGSANDLTRLRVCFQGLTAESGTAPYTPAEDLWTFTARGTCSQDDIDRIVAEVKTPLSGFTGFLASVAQALNGTSNHEVTFTDGRRSIEFVTAVYQSSRGGSRPVSFPVTRDNVLFDGWLPE